MKLSDFIEEQLSYEKYAFSWKELCERTGASPSTLRKALDQAIKRRELVRLRKEFYVILPPQYRNYGKLPIQLYIQDLFDHLGKPYYLAFYTAAFFHGATHQRIQKDYVMTVPPPLRKVERGKFRIDFFKTSRWPKGNILSKSSDAGEFKISSPALTAADLVHHQKSLGGLERVVSVLDELKDSIDALDIMELLSWYPYKSVLQRLGFLLDELRASPDSLGPLTQLVREEKVHPVLLSPEKGKKPGKARNEWKVDKNVELKVER